MTTPAITLVPRARPVVELGVGDSYTPVGTGQWHVSRWGQASATWVGIEPIWLDISCYVQDVSTFVGHERSTDSWRIGTAVVTLNNESGWADYPPTDPLAHPLLSVRPGRQVRIGVYIDNAVDPLWLWRGYTDEATPDYSPDAEPTVTLTCIDAKGEVGRTGIAKLAATTGASETVTDRINRILNAANWSVYRRSLDASGAELIATELGAKAADLLDIAADSGGGSVFGDNDGKVAYRNRDWQMYEADEPVDGTIGNSRTVTVDGYVDFPGTASNYLSSPDEAALDIVGDICIVARIAMDDWTPAATQTICAKLQASGQYSYGCYVDSAGSLGGFTSPDGTNFVFYSSTVATGVANGAWKWVAWTLDVDNGAAGKTARFWLSDDGTTWVQLGADVTTGGTTSIFSSTSQLEIGAELVGNYNLAGLLQHVSIRNGIGAVGIVGGTEVFRFDADTDIGTDTAATTITVSTGQTVTVNRSGSPSTTLVLPVYITDVCPNAWETSFARADMATRVHVARHTDDAPVTASDDAAIALYGVETYERLDLETEATINLVSLAFRHLAVRSHTTLPRIVSVDLDASRAGVLDLLAIADPRIAPRFRCRHVVGTRTVFDREMFAVAIEHKINADTWTARISLDDAAAYLFAGGTWGSARWQRALWAS